MNKNSGLQIEALRAMILNAPFQSLKCAPFVPENSSDKVVDLIYGDTLKRYISWLKSSDVLIVRDFSHKTAIGSSTSLCANTKNEDTHKVILIIFSLLICISRQFFIACLEIVSSVETQFLGKRTFLVCLRQRLNSIRACY